jgi:3-hydroxybutyryl-CoA dehydrogenase
MIIVVIGDETNFHECQEKFGSDHAYTWAGHDEFSTKVNIRSDVLFDFLAEPSSWTDYGPYAPAIIFLNASTFCLQDLTRKSQQPFKCDVFGFAGMPTFVNREILEVTLCRKDDLSSLKSVCGQLNTAFQVVDDRVGMVTPRVICMIINEAYYTAQDGTATR